MMLARFQIEHMDAILPHLRQEHVDAIQALGYDTFRGQIEQALSNSVILTFMDHNGDPVAVFGAAKRWEGCASCWGMVTNKVDKSPVSFLRASRRGMGYIRDILGLRRFDATVRADNSMNMKWLIWLGFKLEGLLESYGPAGEDHFLLARVW